MPRFIRYIEGNNSVIGQQMRFFGSITLCPKIQPTVDLVIFLRSWSSRCQVSISWDRWRWNARDSQNV